MACRVRITDGKMPHVHLPGTPGRITVRFAGTQTHAKQGELVAKATPAVGLQVACQVPPLDGVFRVGTMVPRKRKRTGFKGAGKAGIGFRTHHLGDAQHRHSALWRVVAGRHKQQQ